MSDLEMEPLPGMEMTVEELSQHEAVIERGQQTFVEVGLALLAIREAKGYRTAGYATFEAYCVQRWGWTRGRGYQLMRAAEFTAGLQGEMDTAVHIPESEREARQMMAEQRQVEGEEEPPRRWGLQRPPDSLSPLPEPEERPYLAPEPPPLRPQQREGESLAETSARLLANVGDPEGRVARSRLLAAYTTAVYQMRSNLLPLDIPAVVAVLRPIHVESTESLIRDLRTWADAMEREIQESKTLRVIGGFEA